MAKNFIAYIYDIDSKDSVALSVDSISEPYTTGKQICIGDTDIPEWEVKKVMWINGSQIVLVKQFVIDNI